MKDRILHIVAALMFMTASMFSQDTLIVQWANPDGTVKVNALKDAIVNDNTPPDGRIYRLLKGGFYWLSEGINIKDRPLRLIGEIPNPKDPLQSPAVIQMVKKIDGSIDGYILIGNGNVTLKNLYITGRDGDNIQSYYQPLQMKSSNSRFIIDNCIFERSNHALIAFLGEGNRIYFTNNKFRNLIGQPSTQQTEGIGISIYGDQDTVIIENNTFFNIGMTPYQHQNGMAKYTRFNHNTLVNIGKTILQPMWLLEAYFTNTLIVNGFFHGESEVDYDPNKNPTRDPRASTTGMFIVSILPYHYTSLSSKIVFSNASNFLDPQIAKYHYSYKIRQQPFIGPVTYKDFMSSYPYPQILYVRDTIFAQDPGLKTYPTECIDNMIQNIKNLRAGNIPATPYFYKDTKYATDVTWPLPEDFSYANLALKTYSTDKLPLGDLNWFPTDLETWIKSKPKYVTDIEAVPYGPKRLPSQQTIEAESGVLSGSATVKEVKGFVYKRMGTGYIEWKFNLEKDAILDMNLLVNLNNRVVSSVHWYVNGFEIHDPGNLTKYQFGNCFTCPLWTFPPTGFSWFLVRERDLAEFSRQPLHFKAGINIIRIAADLCDGLLISTIRLQIPETSTIIKELLATDITAEQNVTSGVLGEPWTPSGFKYVSMGTNGTCTFSIVTDHNCYFQANIAYQNLGVMSKAIIKINDKPEYNPIVINAANYKVDKPAEIDSSGGSTKYYIYHPLTKGTNNFSISGSNFNLDNFQLVNVSICPDVKTENLITRYSLEQNYPNPFNPSTTINYTIPKVETRHASSLQRVTLKVYDLLGREVATLVDEYKQPGNYEAQLSAISHQLSSGVYFYTLRAGDPSTGSGHSFIQTKKMVLMK